MEELAVKIKIGTLKEIIYALYEVSSTLCEDVFDLQLSGILNKNHDLSEAENARDYLVSNYERIASATRLMAAATDVICTALTNNDIGFARTSGHEN